MGRQPLETERYRTDLASSMTPGVTEFQSIAQMNSHYLLWGFEFRPRYSDENVSMKMSVETQLVAAYALHVNIYLSERALTPKNKVGQDRLGVESRVLLIPPDSPVPQCAGTMSRVHTNTEVALYIRCPCT